MLDPNTPRYAASLHEGLRQSALGGSGQALPSTPVRKTFFTVWVVGRAGRRDVPPEPRPSHALHGHVCLVVGSARQAATAPSC